MKRHSLAETCKNQEGVALIATLILGMIAISFTLTMVYLAREGTRMAGVEGRYQQALQAAKGGVEVAIDYIRHCPNTNNNKPNFETSTNDTLECYCYIGPTGNRTYYPCDGATSQFSALFGEYQTDVSIEVKTLVSTCDNAPYDPTKRSVVSFCKITSSATNTNPDKKEHAAVEALYKMVTQNCNN